MQRVTFDAPAPEWKRTRRRRVYCYFGRKCGRDSAGVHAAGEAEEEARRDDEEMSTEESEDELDGDVRAQVDEAKAGLRGAGPMTEEDEEAQYKAQAAEDRRSSRVEASGRLGASDRARGMFDVHPVKAAKPENEEEDGRRLLFECCMLQTRIERDDGSVRWRDMSCDNEKDDDDFEALWSKRWAIGDFEQEPPDDVLALPLTRPKLWRTPLDMLAAREAGNRMARFRVLRSYPGRADGEGGESGAPSNAPETIGSKSRYAPAMDGIGARTRSKTGGAVAVPKEGVRGRPVKKRRVVEDKLAMHMHIREKKKKEGTEEEGEVSKVSDAKQEGTRSSGQKGDEFGNEGEQKGTKSSEQQADQLQPGWHEMHFVRSATPAAEGEEAWRLMPQARRVAGRKAGECANYRNQVKSGVISSEYKFVPLKKIPVRVAKYDLRLRENSLRAVHAMHTILSHVVLFRCKHCKERFPTFHPAYEPPPTIAKDMQILRRGNDGLAACSVEVSSWDELPPLEARDGPAFACMGTCLRCQKDMDKQLKSQGGDEERAVVVARRSEDNHMDPCFRFPFDDLQDLFDGATMVESMLVALEHMQVNFVTVSRTGLRKFRKNTISFPQDFASFALRHGMMKGYEPGDRVNSVRGRGHDINREIRKAVHSTEEEREGHLVDGSGAIVFPATVREVLRDGRLVLDYDYGGDGVELPEHVRPRVVMPHHPKNVPLHMMLRRNVGGGRDPLEGLQVRWWVVARLLHALCSLPPNGHGPWRIGGTELEPMHKYYDPKAFDVLHGRRGYVPEVEALEAELKVRFAPKVSEGVVLSEADASKLTRSERSDMAVDVQQPDQFIAAGFDVNFVGPEDEVLPRADAGPDSDLCVEEEVFCRWLDLSAMRVGSAVARWWQDEECCEEGAVDGLKCAEDETTVELYGRVQEEINRRRAEENLKPEGGVRLEDFVSWLLRRVGEGLGAEYVASPEMLADDVLHEWTIVSSLQRALGDDRGCMEEPVETHQEEEEARQLAEGVVYGWPGTAAEPTGAMSYGRFVKAHPLDFPMGIADLYEERPHKVSVEEWVQHLLRYWTGHFVGGLRGQRVVWSMVNVLLLSEARRRGYGIYRNVLRRVGFGVQGREVLTKGQLRAILASEDAARTLVGQLSTVGRDVRSTPMQWAYEGKKLDAAVKHLSWVPPWVNFKGPEGDESGGRRYLDTKDAPKDDGGSDQHTATNLRLVDDDVGLGRLPSSWWTLNCKYNAAYDVQRLNLAKGGKDAVDERVGGNAETRFIFARDNPDLVAFMLALRTELHMRMVMPTVVRQTEWQRYMAMCRFEVGPGGNAHYHGFSVGAKAPVMKRVRADLEGEGDEQPDMLVDEMKAVHRIFASVESGAPLRESALRRRLYMELTRAAEKRQDGDAARGRSGDGAVGASGTSSGDVEMSAAEQPLPRHVDADGAGGDAQGVRKDERGHGADEEGVLAAEGAAAGAVGVDVEQVGAAEGEDNEGEAASDTESDGAVEDAARTWNATSRRVHEVLREIVARGIAEVSEEVETGGAGMVRMYRLVSSVERTRPDDVAHAAMTGSTKDRLDCHAGATPSRRFEER